MIHLSSDWSSIDAELDRVINHMPGVKGKILLDSALNTAFAHTQAQVHVITGSLKGSGKESSEVDHFDHKWEGIISYGGPTTGPKNPVNYAIYEKRREATEKGNHDFMAGLSFFDPLFVAAVKGALKG